MFIEKQRNDFLESLSVNMIPSDVFLLGSETYISSFLSSKKDIAIGSASFSEQYDEIAKNWLDSNRVYEKEFSTFDDLDEEEEPVAYSLLRPFLSMGRAIEKEVFTKKRLTIKTIQGQMCPLFHVDRVYARLIVTLIGPGTEWLLEKDLIRRNLGKGGKKPISKEDSYVQQVLEKQVAVLKGSRYQGSKGLVHRSPPSDPSWDSRLILRIDYT